MGLTAHQIQDEYDNLKTSVVRSIQEMLDNYFGGQYDLATHDEEFKDEAGNELTHLNKKDVYFPDIGDISSKYPLFELGIQDAIYILGLLEDRVEEEELEPTEL